MHVGVWGTRLRGGHEAIHGGLTHPVLGVNQGGGMLGRQHALGAHPWGAHTLRSWSIAQQAC